MSTADRIRYPRRKRANRLPEVDAVEPQIRELLRLHHGRASITFGHTGRLVPTDHSLDFIRSASAAPLDSRVLNPKDWSSLTSMNAWLLTSPQLHTQKVLETAGGRVPYKSV
jgi:hypothetical protein